MITTKAIIYQEQKDGGYKGVEVNLDGYPEEVGYIIHHKYQEPTKVQSFIDNRYCIASLGVSNEVLENVDALDPRRNEACIINGQKFAKYTIVSMVRGYYTANNVQAIINGEITEHDEENIDRELEHPSYSYYQTLNGEWFIIDHTRKNNCVAKKLSDVIVE